MTGKRRRYEKENYKEIGGEIPLNRKTRLRHLHRGVPHPHGRTPRCPPDVGKNARKGRQRNPPTGSKSGVGRLPLEQPAHPHARYVCPSCVGRRSPGQIMYKQKKRKRLILAESAFFSYLTRSPLMRSSSPLSCVLTVGFLTQYPSVSKKYSLPPILTALLTW